MCNTTHELYFTVLLQESFWLNQILGLRPRIILNERKKKEKKDEVCGIRTPNYKIKNLNPGGNDKSKTGFLARNPTGHFVDFH